MGAGGLPREDVSGKLCAPKILDSLKDKVRFNIDRLETNTDPLETIELEG